MDSPASFNVHIRTNASFEWSILSRHPSLKITASERRTSAHSFGSSTSDMSTPNEALSFTFNEASSASMYSQNSFVISQKMASFKLIVPSFYMITAVEVYIFLAHSGFSMMQKKWHLGSANLISSQHKLVLLVNVKFCSIDAK